MVAGHQNHRHFRIEPTKIRHERRIPRRLRKQICNHKVEALCFQSIKGVQGRFRHRYFISRTTQNDLVKFVDMGVIIYAQDSSARHDGGKCFTY